MIAALQRAIDVFRGSGKAAVTIPPLDGAMRPNTMLEDAAELLVTQQPDNLVSDRDTVYFSSGTTVSRVSDDPATAVPVHQFDAAVTALAAYPGVGLIAALADGSLRFCSDESHQRRIDRLAGERLVNVTALAFEDARHLLVCQGSARNPAAEWKRDLLEHGSSGQVWRVDLDSGDAVSLAEGLAYPYGIAPQADGSVVVTESWRHRLLHLHPGAPPQVILEDLPGYPARLTPSHRGGWWLSVFAPRNQLVEFVLREETFKRRMMAEVPAAFWLAPSLTAPRTFLEPLQGGGLKQLGILKPWAPSFSYGLVVQLDAEFLPLRSFHSRADGQRHAVTSCLARGERLWVASRGGDRLLEVDLSVLMEEWA
jgi:hypothetical protein